MWLARWSPLTMDPVAERCVIRVRLTSKTLRVGNHGYEPRWLNP